MLVLQRRRYSIQQKTAVNFIFVFQVDGQSIKQHMGQDYAELVRLKDGPASDILLEGIQRLKASVCVVTELFMQ